MPPKIKTEPVKVREPDKPKCPIHTFAMEYKPVEGAWRCPVEQCSQAAFPQTVLEKGKPVIGSGDIELVQVDDPDGDKEGRYLLRAMENNIILDITDYVIHFGHGDRGNVLVDLTLWNHADGRTR